MSTHRVNWGERGRKNCGLFWDFIDKCGCKEWVKIWVSWAATLWHWVSSWIEPSSSGSSSVITCRYSVMVNGSYRHNVTSQKTWLPIFFLEQCPVLPNVTLTAGSSGNLQQLMTGCCHSDHQVLAASGCLPIGQSPCHHQHLHCHYHDSRHLRTGSQDDWCLQYLHSNPLLHLSQSCKKDHRNLLLYIQIIRLCSINWSPPV
jgi:hypothetical protein